MVTGFLLWRIFGVQSRTNRQNIVVKMEIFGRYSSDMSKGRHTRDASKMSLSFISVDRGYLMIKRSSEHHSFCKGMERSQGRGCKVLVEFFPLTQNTLVLMCVPQPKKDLKMFLGFFQTKVFSNVGVPIITFQVKSLRINA